MKILFIVFHPVDPQIVRYVAKNLIENKHSVLFLIYEKENIIEKIIKYYGFRYEVVGQKPTKNIFANNSFLLTKLYRKIVAYDPDIVFSPTSPYAGLASYFGRTKLVCWADTETATRNLRTSLPFVDTLFVADTFGYHFDNKKAIRFPGYKELAYLHPHVFHPDRSVLEELKIRQSEKIVLLRFAALTAMHDIGLKSVVEARKEKILYYVKELEKFARVFISMTEKDLGPDFEKYRLKIHPAKYTSLLAFCSLYIGEGTTTASEAGVLGVPWINLQKATRGYLIDQENNYGLGFRIDDIDLAFQKGLELIQDDSLPVKWQMKREKLLQDKIDLTAFFTWFFENYPDSVKTVKADPDYPKRFK